jgi:hypothetical protein
MTRTSFATSLPTGDRLFQHDPESWCVDLLVDHVRFQDRVLERGERVVLDPVRNLNGATEPDDPRGVLRLALQVLLPV